MNKLFVAGDSFASLVKNQEEGVTWTELLAKELNLDLVNIARPGASNFFICFQIEHILDMVEEEDIVLIYLTDNSRAVIPNQELQYQKDIKSILECFDSSFFLKRTEHILYQDPAIQKGKYLSTIMNFSPAWKRVAVSMMFEDWSRYYKEFYDPWLQYKNDVLTLTGALHKLALRTKRFLVCSGGFGENLDLDFYIYNIDKDLSIFNKTIDSNTFGIDQKNWLQTSSRALETRSGKVEYVNHLDDFCHKVLFKRVFNKLNSDILNLSP